MGTGQEGQAAQWRHEVTAHMTDKPGEDFKGSKATKHFRALLGVKEGTYVKMIEYKILATGCARTESTNILGLVFFYF